MALPLIELLMIVIDFIIQALIITSLNLYKQVEWHGMSTYIYAGKLIFLINQRIILVVSTHAIT